MTSQQIAIFLSLAENLNFTQTAKEYYTTQPTVSRQISLLEEELGFPLFIRNKKEVRLTFQGTVMKEKFKEAQEAVKDGIRQVRRMQSGENLQLRIGSLEGMDPDLFVAPGAACFNRQYPSVRVSVERRSFGELRRKLDRGDLDLIFTLDFETKYLNDILYEEYYPLHAGILMSEDHPLASIEDLKARDFSGQTFILPEEYDSPGRTEELREILRRSGIVCGDIIYVPNEESILLNIRSAKGVGLLDSSWREVRDARYRFFELDPETARLTAVCVWKKDNSNPAVSMYVDMLRQKIKH